MKCIKGMEFQVNARTRRERLRHERARSRITQLGVAVPAIALAAGAVAATTLDVRFGLLAAAIVLGWSQLVGL